jgi:hypothetical protein
MTHGQQNILLQFTKWITLNFILLLSLQILPMLTLNAQHTLPVPEIQGRFSGNGIQKIA